VRFVYPYADALPGSVAVETAVFFLSVTW